MLPLTFKNKSFLSIFPFIRFGHTLKVYDKQLNSSFIILVELQSLNA